MDSTSLEKYDTEMYFSSVIEEAKRKGYKEGLKKGLRKGYIKALKKARKDAADDYQVEMIRKIEELVQKLIADDRDEAEIETMLEKPERFYVLLEEYGIK